MHDNVLYKFNVYNECSAVVFVYRPESTCILAASFSCTSPPATKPSPLTTRKALNYTDTGVWYIANRTGKMSKTMNTAIQDRKLSNQYIEIDDSTDEFEYT